MFGCGDVGRLRGPAAQERELEHLIEPYAQHLDASSRTRATRPSLHKAVGFAAAYACRRLYGAITPWRRP